MATTAKPRPYSPAFSASMAAFNESRFVWSATFVMVVTTWLMFPAFSFSTASFALIKPAACMTMAHRLFHPCQAILTAPCERGGLVRDAGHLVDRFDQHFRGRGDLF